MIYEINELKDKKDISKLSIIAEEIFKEHFTPVIGIDQVEYMADKFQSVSSISEQIENGYKYFFLTVDELIIGYFAILYDTEKSYAQLSKIYLKKANRGFGFGNIMFEYILNECRKINIHKLWLVVNKKNKGPIGWYKKKGFTITDEQKKDIGGGFYMDDFVMEKEISY